MKVVGFGLERGDLATKKICDAALPDSGGEFENFFDDIILPSDSEIEKIGWVPMNSKRADLFDNTRAVIKSMRSSIPSRLENQIIYSQREG